MLKKIGKILLWIFGTILVLILGLFLLLFFEVRPPVPKMDVEWDSEQTLPTAQVTSDSLFYIGNNKFRKNRNGLYELYVEGSAFERGLNGGVLASDLIKYQEEVFVGKITEIIPSERYRSYLLTMIIWFNSRLHKHINPEIISEVHGISYSASHDFDFYGPSFFRLLYYHAAHDIGHTLQAYNLVGCSSFAVWNQHSVDSSLLVGRNFDFYFGEEFSKNKIVEFVNPDNGYKFAFITWGGMTGVVSGMNEMGLTVTINAGTPTIAKRSGTPVSMLAREILQFASTIKEADSIAASRRTFVSESYLISSSIDDRAAIIEKSPYEQELVEGVDSRVLCTNHYLGKKTGSVEQNEETKKKATLYRYHRMQQLLDQNENLTPIEAASILRNQKGLNNENLGMANEMALNQLIAHHSVIFSPAKKIMWVSTPPNVLGPYMAYNLDSVFANFPKLAKNKPIDDTNLCIPADTFLNSHEYVAYKEYSKLKEKYIFFNFMGNPVSDSIYQRLIELNPASFEPWMWYADVLEEEGKYKEALDYYGESSKRIMPPANRAYIEKQSKTCLLNLSQNSDD